MAKAVVATSPEGGHSFAKLVAFTPGQIASVGGINVTTHLRWQACRRDAISVSHSPYRTRHH